MKVENFTYLSSNGITEIEYTLWIPEKEPKGIVQIVHGMCEHIARYSDFATFLVGHGYAVCANNHLGHGMSLVDDTQGYFGEKGSYKYLVEDVRLLRLLMLERFDQKKYFILGHSMGSFVTRLFLAKYSFLVDGALISGTSGPNPQAEILGYSMAKSLRALHGSKYVSHKLDALLVGSFSKRYKNACSKNAWISTEQSVVAEYDADAQCGFVFTVGGYCELLTMMRLVSHPKWASLIIKQLPILLFSGEKDPVGQYGKGVLAVKDALISAGQQDVCATLYKDGRHEMLNEVDHERVYEDVLNWLEMHN